jgi:hypothetical protein
MFDNKIGPPRIVITRKIYYRRASVEAFLAKSEGFDRVPMIRRRVRRNARRAA